MHAKNFLFCFEVIVISNMKWGGGVIGYVEVEIKKIVIYVCSVRAYVMMLPSSQTAQHQMLQRLIINGRKRRKLSRLSQAVVNPGNECRRAVSFTLRRLYKGEQFSYPVEMKMYVCIC